MTPAARRDMRRHESSPQSRKAREKKRRERRKTRKAGVLVISFPKGGRTWLRILVGKALCDSFKLDPSLMLDPFKLAPVAGLPPTLFTHDGSSNTLGKRYDELGTDKPAYRKKKVAYLTRNPLDVLVSCYFEATKRRRVFRGDISEFLRHDNYGLRKILTYNRIWEANRRTPREFLLLRNEDMHESPERALRAVLRLMGAPDIDDEIIEGAVSFSTFDNMKQMEKSGHFGSRKLMPGDVNDAESYKVRKGKVIGYTDYLGVEDLNYAKVPLRKSAARFIPKKKSA